jgi:hypothetical protein
MPILVLFDEWILAPCVDILPVSVERLGKQGF